MEALLIAGAIEIIKAIRAGLEAGKIKPEDLQELGIEMDDLKAKRDAAVARWDAAADSDRPD